MMTTMAALLATLPIAFGYGAGAEARRPLGLAVVGGLIFSRVSDPVHYAGYLYLSGQVAGEVDRISKNPANFAMRT